MILCLNYNQLCKVNIILSSLIADMTNTHTHCFCQLCQPWTQLWLAFLFKKLFTIQLQESGIGWHSPALNASDPPQLLDYDHIYLGHFPENESHSGIMYPGSFCLSWNSSNRQEPLSWRPQAEFVKSLIDLHHFHPILLPPSVTLHRRSMRVHHPFSIVP